MGPRAISTSDVRHSPAVLPVPRGFMRLRSAHSGMLMRGGGRQPRANDRASLAAGSSIGAL